MALENWSPALKSLMETVEGIGEVRNYDELPGDIIVSKTMLIMPREVDGAYSQGGPNITHYRVDLALYHPGQLLSEGYAVLVPFIRLVRDKIWSNITLDGLVMHCQTVSPPEKWADGPGRLLYGENNHIGIIFRLDVKEAESVTVSA